jgi:uncharacterized protein YvpB
MTWKQAFPKIYRTVKSKGIRINSITLIKKLKEYNEKVPNMTEQHIQAITNKIIATHKVVQEQDSE